MKVLLLTAATILGVSAVLILLTTSVPAAQTVQVAKLSLGAHIEVAAIARK